jgi:DNA primase
MARFSLAQIVAKCCDKRNKTYSGAVMADIERLRREVSLHQVAVNHGVVLQKNGQEWEGCCPFHQENTPSFTVFRGKDGIERFHCFGCNERGDVVDFVKLLKGVDTREAVLILGGGRAGPNVAPRQVEARDPYAGIELLVPTRGIKAGAPVRLYNPKRERFGSATPSMVFPYYRAGQPLGYVLRNDLSDGAKETPMVCWVRLADGTECWSRFPFPRPRPLYIGGGSDRLREGQVIIVEGEKCADAMVRMGGRQAVSWPGGTFGVDHTEWSPLSGRSVVIWPDADKPGIATAEKIARTLAAIGCTIKVACPKVAA